MPKDKYSDPTKFCDVVMKGGITSGVVYPLAVCELAQTYQLRNIGGTSAGAIAAAAAAAAEYGRTRGGGSFAEFEQLPQWLGQVPRGRSQSRLLSLFQPQEQTKPIFDTLIAGIGPNKAKWCRAIAIALRGFPAGTWLGGLPGIILICLAFQAADGPLLAWCLLSGVVLMGIGILGVTLFLMIRRVIRAVPENFYGLCSGRNDSETDGDPCLTSWLASYLDRLAGKHADAGPLTFGDLWGTRDPQAERQINLEMMTTNLTQGRPYRLPIESSIFYFHSQEFRRLFPESIVRWMEQHPRAGQIPDRYAELGLCPMPDAADLPVVVAARLSLSFPLLISAIPLYAIDYSRKVEESQRRPERCWFSDGGICSNFPVHFFDSPLPRWPTFAINLRPCHPDYQTMVRMPESNAEGILDWWCDLEKKTGSKKLLEFFSLIIAAMQNWMDNTQAQLPGYRDRVVHVSLKPDEGGLNLNMPPALIAQLSNRGRDAGLELVGRFALNNPPCELSWDNHRWVRYRSSMALIEEMLRKFDRAFRHPMPGDRTYGELIQRDRKDLPASYFWVRKTQQEFATLATTNLSNLAEGWLRSGETFTEKAPHPMAELRARPRI